MNTDEILIFNINIYGRCDWSHCITRYIKINIEDKNSPDNEPLINEYAPVQNFIVTGDNKKKIIIEIKEIVG